MLQSISSDIPRLDPWSLSCQMPPNGHKAALLFDADRSRMTRVFSKASQDTRYRRNLVQDTDPIAQKQ